jgi:hypothetical protein
VSVGLGVAELVGDAVGLADVVVGVGDVVGFCVCVGCGLLLGLGAVDVWLITTLGVGLGAVC